MKYRRQILLVLLPFAAGYFLSYFYRTINAVISAELSSTMQLRASDLGLLTAVYFLSFAAMQLPLGVALDRYGPRRVQGVLLLVAAIGAALFGSAQTLAGFIIGRALIGLGVAAALIAGLKSIRLWFPKEQLPLLNGCFIMLGTLGALTATAPAEMIVAWIGWRALFAGLAAATAACAVLIVVLSPEPVGERPQPGHGARQPEADLYEPAFLAGGTAVDYVHQHGLGAAGIVGGTVARGCRESRPSRDRAPSFRDGSRTLCRSPSPRHPG